MQFRLIRSEGNAVPGSGPADPAIALRYAETDAAFTARDAAARDADERARREALPRLQQLTSRIEALAARPDLSLKAGERALKGLRRTPGAITQHPSKTQYEE